MSFDALEMPQVVPSCPLCHSYKGLERPEDVLWDVLYHNPAQVDELPEPELAFGLENSAQVKRTPHI